MWKHFWWCICNVSSDQLARAVVSFIANFILMLMLILFTKVDW